MTYESSKSPTAPAVDAHAGDRQGAGGSVRTSAGQMLKKVPEVTIWFWIIKIPGALAAVLAWQLGARRYIPFV